MYVKQISIFLENRPGKLAAFADLLGREGIDLVAVSIADTEDFGILRCIVCDWERATKVLTDAGYTSRVTDVLAVRVPDRPGGMAEAIGVLTAAGVSIEYMYSFIRSAGDNALLVFRVKQLAVAEKAITDAGIPLITQDQVRGL